MVFLVLVKGIPNGWVSSPLMEDQWVNWESNLYVRVGRCKKKLKCKFNVLMPINIHFLFHFDGFVNHFTYFSTILLIIEVTLTNIFF